MNAPVMEKVCAGNFSEFLSLIRCLAAFEHLVPPDAAAEERLMADALGKTPRYEAYLAKCGEKAAGYVTFYFTYSTFLARPTLYLEDIFVLENFRGQGIGSHMLGFCRKIARERGCGRMEWMVLDWNEPAIRFYTKSGAKKLGWFVYRLDSENL